MVIELQQSEDAQGNIYYIVFVDGVRLNQADRQLVSLVHQKLKHKEQDIQFTG